jgi:hypothetical protein
MKGTRILSAATMAGSLLSHLPRTLNHIFIIFATTRHPLLKSEPWTPNHKRTEKHYKIIIIVDTALEMDHSKLGNIKPN